MAAKELVCKQALLYVAAGINRRRLGNRMKDAQQEAWSHLTWFPFMVQTCPKQFCLERFKI